MPERAAVPAPGERRVAVVTGANRGLGLEVVRQLAARGYRVVLGARDLAKGSEAAARLGSDAVVARKLDVTSKEDSDALAAFLRRTSGRVDVLVNGAAISYDTWQDAATADLAAVREAFETNLLGAWRAAQACVPLMRERGYGRIVNVSSGAGAISSMGAGTPAYATSKAALNALTRILAAELRGTGILVNAVCPGWVATDMGGPGGRPVEEGAEGVVWAATLPDDGPTGGFFRDGGPIAW
jgi:NAD(P)-dependent dehydrogenase (short-subunit alcohol dehydrogenase family)